ncbi:MAG: acyltransferase family protein, partial [Actinomycetota bacterium]
TGATVLLIVALENARGGPVATLLASAPLTALGRISYGTYLWHWPIIVLVALEVELAPVVDFGVAALGATLLAAVSYTVMERPIRATPRLEGRAGPVIAVGLACSLALGLLVMPRVLDSGGAEVAGVTGSGGPGPSLTNWRIALNDVPGLPDCLGRPATACTLVKGDGPHVLVLGDSIARMWIPALVQLAARDGFTLSAAIMPGCPWLRGVYYRQTRSTWDECSEKRNDWYARMVPELAPDLVVVAQLDPQGALAASRDKSVVANDGTVIAPNDPGFAPFLGDRVAESLDALAAPGRRVVVLEPVASAPLAADPLRCLSRGEDPVGCAFSGPAEPTPLEAILRARAGTDPSVVTLDLDRVACPTYPRCEALIGDVIVWRDGSHLTATYARTLADGMGGAFAAAGVDLGS